MGVQNVVVVDRPAPQPFAAREVPVPEGALAALREQLDLTEVELDPGLVLFEVDGPWPLRSDISDLELPERRRRRAARRDTGGVGAPTGGARYRNRHAVHR